MTIEKKVSILCSLILIFSIGGFGIYEWVAKDIVNAMTIIFIFIGIAMLFHSITWGDLDGKHESEKDELEKHITLTSTKISYYVLFLLMSIVLIVSEGVTAMNDIQNIPLVIAIGLAWITLPITEFIVSRKYL